MDDCGPLAAALALLAFFGWGILFPIDEMRVWTLIRYLILLLGSFFGIIILVDWWCR